MSQLKNDLLKFEYQFIFLTTIIVSMALFFEYHQEKKRLLIEKKQYQIDNYFKPKKRHLTLAFSTIYQNIRTISLLPSIRGIQKENRLNDTLDLVTEGKFSKEGAETFQQIYNNLASNINVSEVYCIVDGFNPEKKEVPALMYDNLIINPKREKQKEGITNTTDHDTPEEKEEDEYLEYVNQLHIFKKKYPQFIFKKLDEIPVTTSQPLRTCDNSQYLSKKDGNVHNAMGITYSVPFYDEDNHFKGIISAVVRLNIFEAIFLDLPFVPITKQDEISFKNLKLSLPQEQARFALVNKNKNIIIFDRRNDVLFQDIK